MIYIHTYIYTYIHDHIQGISAADLDGISADHHQRAINNLLQREPYNDKDKSYMNALHKDPTNSELLLRCRNAIYVLTYMHTYIHTLAI